MSAPSESTGNLGLPELLMILQDLEDGTLTPGQREELMTRLEQSPATRRAYLEYFQQSAVFKMEGAKMHERGLLPVVESNAPVRQAFRRSVMAAAAVIAVSAIVATLIAVKQPKPGLLSAAVAADTRWTVDGEQQDSHSEELMVLEGCTVRVWSGTVTLRLESGAVMVMQGPALASFPELHRPVLKNGWLWIDSAESDDPFEVDTPEVLVRDIGTRFGVRVSEEAPAEVHLVEGLIEVITKDSGQLLTAMAPVGKGFAIPATGDPTELPLARDPFPDLPELLAAKSNYRTTVLSQAPEGYWKFDEEDSGELANEIPEGMPAAHSLEAVVGEAGVGRDQGFNGFQKANRSVYLPGELAADRYKSVLVGLDGPRGVSRREGAVAFWIRRLPGIEREETLWLAGETHLEGSIPQQALVHTHLTDSGRVGLFIENGKFDVVLTSPRAVDDGRWHHIAASWGPSSVDLYVDGKHAARDADSRILQEGVSSGRFLRFGKPSGELFSQGIRNFTGWVDEIAIWNRPLTPAETSHQFQSARGSSADRPNTGIGPQPNRED